MPIVKALLKYDQSNFSLLIFSIGFLFKVSAAPFHFWSPETGFGKSCIVGSIQSNSGNPLELQVPSHNGNIVGGWSNYSGMVISYSINESEMEYRGSKSEFLNYILVRLLDRLIYSNVQVSALIKFSVKEQRVDGSYCIKN